MDFATSVAVSRTRVFVTGHSFVGSANDYATVAYSAASGKKLWIRKYNGSNAELQAESVAVNPSGAVVFVTGTSAGRATGDDYATVAYSAATGRQLWASRYNDPRTAMTAPAHWRSAPTGKGYS